MTRREAKMFSDWHWERPQKPMPRELQLIVFRALYWPWYKRLFFFFKRENNR